MHFDLTQIIQQVGYIGLFLIVFAESGLLIGFFLPGDSLLFTAGFLASQKLPSGDPILNIYLLVFICAVAAIVGDSVGYVIGKKTGRKIFKKEDSFFFNKNHLITAEKFYKKHGGKTIILARFTPIVRTFAPMVAGMGDMNYGTFLFYNITGGLFWVFSMCFGGYFLGQIIPDVDKYLLPIILLIIIASLAPSVYHVLKEKENRDNIRSQLYKMLNRK